MRINGDCAAWLTAGYPRPLICRESWLNLAGPWAFCADPRRVGARERWHAPGAPFPDTITVPFPPGTERSGLSGPGYDTEVVWYRRTVTPDELAALPDSDGERLILTFEGVDHTADVWGNGQHLAHHVGGYSRFEVDVTDALASEGLEVVVRAEDPRRDVEQPRGKQEWRERPHGIWYQRSTGIWREVWMERRPALAVTALAWHTDLEQAQVSARLTLTRAPRSGTSVTVSLSHDGELLGTASVACLAQETIVTIPVPALRNRMEWPSLLWTPARPHLAEARISLTEADGDRNSSDEVVSYTGLREVTTSQGYLCLNREPVYVRAVLDQGYWEDSAFTPPSNEALREDIALARRLGLNTLRVHQRTPDLRYLAWADRLGMMVWAEYPAAYAFSRRAVGMLTAEWARTVEDCAGHPSVVVWVPFNESWGVPLVATDPAQQAFVDGVVSLTRALDPTRPVIANDGWEQRGTDIVTVHDYGTHPEELRANYADDDTLTRTLTGAGPQGRRILLDQDWDGRRPVMVSEFGGISLAAADAGSWGYAVVSTTEEYEEVVGGLLDALYASPLLAGWCYTQLTDTAQETNGLCRADRTLKLGEDRTRALLTRGARAFRTHIRPRAITQVPALDNGEPR